MANRKAPMARLMTKLGLRQFRNVGPLNDTLLPADRVGIKLKQHVGAPCEPAVDSRRARDERARRSAARRWSTASRPSARRSTPRSTASSRRSTNGVVWIENDDTVEQD